MGARTVISQLIRICRDAERRLWRFIPDTVNPASLEVATLSGFASVTTGPGVSLQQLGPLDELLVQTRNSCYRIVASRGADIVIQGGSFFPHPTPAHVAGASLGGHLLKAGWIGVGLRMEIVALGRPIVTTKIRSIVRQRG